MCVLTVSIQLSKGVEGCISASRLTGGELLFAAQVVQTKQGLFYPVCLYAAKKPTLESTRRLPPRVAISRLVHPDTLHHLTVVVGKPVKRLNTTGLTYCVALRPRKKQRLPRMVELDLSHRPAGDYVIGFGLGARKPALSVAGGPDLTDTHRAHRRRALAQRRPGLERSLSGR